MNFILRKGITAIVLLCAICAPQTSQACAVCMGANDSRIAPAINAAIFLMLGFVGFMMLSVLGFMFYLSRRSKTPMPPHEELARAIEMEETFT